MSLSRSELYDVRCKTDSTELRNLTTYYVSGKPVCLRPLSSEGKEDQYCELVAGEGTSHYGIGACKHHDGEIHNVNGRYAHVVKRELKKRYDEFNSDSELLNLYPELSLLRALLTDAVALYQDTGTLRTLDLVRTMLSDVVNTVERIERINNSQVLTAHMAKFLMAKAIEVAAKFIEPTNLPAFVETWRSEVQTKLLMPGNVMDVQYSRVTNSKELEE